MSLEADGTLVTESGQKMPGLRLTPATLVDRTIVVYGPSKTGKTVLTKHIMKVVNGHIEQILVVCPSEPTNRSYEGYVDPPFIHYRLYLPDKANPKKDDGTKGALRFLETIWQRQEMMAAIYTRANNADVLARLFGRVPDEQRGEGRRYIQAIYTKKTRVEGRVRAQYAAEPGRRDEKLKEVDEKFKKMLVLLYKKYVAPHYAALYARADLTEDERYSLCYLNFNPRILLVFDDCAADLKPFFNKEVFRKLFYRNRHSLITAVLVCQDDTDLPTNLRKNAFISFFTEQVVCMSNFDRPSNKFAKTTKQYVEDVSREVFQGNRKLAYIREDDRRQHFYHVTVPWPKPFRFGSPASHELCDSVACTGVTMDKENPFYERFAL